MFFWKGGKKMDEELKKDAPVTENGESGDVKAEGAAAEAAAGGEAADANAEVAAEAPVDEAAQWKDKYMRTMADFDNFRKRTARDREDLFKQAAADVIKDILPTVDNLELALSKAQKDDPFTKGVQMVYDGLVKMLEGHGAKRLDALGEPLDPNFHQAIATLPSADVKEGCIMTEVKKGWLLNGKLLRAAQVVVSAGKANEE